MTEGRRLRDDALAIWKAGVEAVHAGNLVRKSLGVGDNELFAFDRFGAIGFSQDLTAVGRIAVVGAGKATTAMARAVVEMPKMRRFIERNRLDGWVNVPDVTVEKLRPIHVHGARKLPDNRPTQQGVDGSLRMLAIAESLREDDLLIVLLSGGGSALMPLPAQGVSLEDKLLVTKLLQERGATIGEMNCVRKHLSRIKGGRLAQATKARVLTLIVSDVIDDPLDVIASGPTARDPTTFEQALVVLDGYDLRGQIPAAALAHLQAGLRGDVPETAKTIDASHVANVVIGNNDLARARALANARRLGYVGLDLGQLVGLKDTQENARAFAKDVRDAMTNTERVCIVTGGETTVALPADHGLGGRNQEYALTLLDELGADGLVGVCVLCGGTDGEDGPTDAAGAFVDEDLARDAAARGLDPAQFLARHDAYNFFAPLGGLVKTGPTQTNVMDLRVVLIDRTEGAAVGAATTPKKRSLTERAKP